MKLTPQEIKNAIQEHESKIQELQEQLKKSSYVTGFEKVSGENEYSLITSRGNIFTDYPDDEEDIEYFEIANYGSEKRMSLLEKMNRLQRLLYRFSAENGGDNIDWDNTKQDKYFLHYNHKTKGTMISWCSFVHQVGQVYFVSREVAEQALEQFIPLMEEIIKEEQEVKEYYLELNSKEKLTSSYKFPVGREFLVEDTIYEIIDIGEDKRGVIYEIGGKYDETDYDFETFTESELEKIILRGSFNE